MSYKTILVHLNDPRRAERLLTAALSVAAHDKVHLIGLHLAPSLAAIPPLAVPYAGDVVNVAVAEERGTTEKLKATFDRMTANQAVVAEWRAVEVLSGDLAEIVVRHGRAADLVVASQSDPDWDFAPVLDFPERIALSAGRPVLVVPNSGEIPSIGRSVMVAWNGSREAARAVFDALPLLQRAASVRVLGLSEASRRPVGEPDIGLAAALARHGVKAEAVQSVAGSGDIGEAILSRLAESDADLLVMGAWGHSRLHELVFGGVTRHIARHMTVPTLLSH